MFNSLLAAVSDEATEIVTWISIASIAALALVLAVICIRSTKFSTNSIAYAAVCVAMSFVLSFIKVSPVQYGGSITLASFVPLLIYAYAFGPIKGLLTGLIFGLLNFISAPYILTPMTFILDYLLAFASIGLMGLAPKFGKLPIAAKVTLGTVAVFTARFIFHLISGFIYFAEGAVWVDLPATNAFVYSLIYQLVYVPADCAICAVTLFALAKTKVFERLLTLMLKKEKQEKASAEPSVNASEK